MREILFHGKRMDNGEWVEGLLFVGFGKTYICPEPTAMYCFDDALCLGGFIEVAPDTVGQYTGLTDSGGAKIFEGDIVEYKGEYGKIVYCDGEAMFSIMSDTWGTDFDHVWGHDVEVIGNIHDDPELLDQ